MNAEVRAWPIDAVWSLSVKLIDLNTNLHNPNVKPMLRYTRETFVAQSMKLEPIKQSFSESQVGQMYDRIAKEKFENKVSLHELYFKRINELAYELVQKHNASGENKQFNKSLTGTLGKRKTLATSEFMKHEVQKEMKAKYDLFHSKGTVFTKYGRYGDPK